MTTATNRRGFFRTAFDAFVAAREREAERYVTGALLSLDDKTLAAHGYSRVELNKRPHANYWL